MNDPAPVPPPAPRDEARRMAWLGHLRSHLGPEVTVLTERSSIDIHLDLIVFPPSPDRTFVTLVTSGMSDVPTTAPDGGEMPRLELAIAVPLGWPGLDPLAEEPLHDETNYWPVRLLKAVARIPTGNDSFLAWAHTINDIQALYPPSTPFSGAVVGPTYGLSPQIMQFESPSGPMRLLAVLPTTPGEMAYRVAVPGGGDSLLERFYEAGVSMVVNPARASVVDGPPPYAVHVLLDHAPPHLGAALESALPNFAAMLAEHEAPEAVFPPTPDPTLPQVRLRLGPSIAARPLLDQAASDPAVAAAVHGHRASVTVMPEEIGIGPTPQTAYSMALQVAEVPGATAVWLPHQRRVLTTAAYVEAMDREPITFGAVHATTTPDGEPAVRTHGLAALGGLEIWYAEPGLSAERAGKRLAAMLERGGDADGPPRAGDVARFGTTRYELAEGLEPGTGEPILLMSEQVREKRRLFGRARKD